jgi:hypothetical protein
LDRVRFVVYAADGEHLPTFGEQGFEFALAGLDPDVVGRPASGPRSLFVKGSA